MATAVRQPQVPAPAGGWALLAACCVLLAAACQPLAAASGAAGPEEGRPGRVACGRYEAVPTGFVGSRPTRLLLQRDGRVMGAVTDYAIASVACAELTGGGAPELLVRTDSGGGHCCETVRVFALAEKPAPLLDYAGGNARGAAARDLDGDGRAELLLGDDGLAYFGDLDFASSPSSLPLVACFDGNGFRDCTAEHPGVLRDAARRFRSRLQEMPPGHVSAPVRGAALGFLAVSLLLGEEAEAREAVASVDRSEALETWLDRARPRLEVWVEARGRKLRRPGS